MDFDATDDWTSGDMLRHFHADYVRGRCMKTDVMIRRDGTFRIETTNRGEAATRWVARLQGKKVLAPVRDLPAETRSE